LVTGGRVRFFSKTKKTMARYRRSTQRGKAGQHRKLVTVSLVEKVERTLMLKPASGSAGKGLTLSAVICAPQALIWDQLISTSTNGVQNEGKWGKLTPGLCLEDRQLKQV